MNQDIKLLSEIEKIFLEKRGYISAFPENKKAVVVLSGGLDSVIMAAFLIKEKGMELFPLHVIRGQSNSVAEERSVDFFTKFFQERYGNNFHSPEKIKVNVPPKEFKQDILPYMKKNGHPMRDPIIHLLAVEYAVAISQKHNVDVKTIFCNIGPEDPFPHTSLIGLRANTFNTCINMNDWGWLITSPNIDKLLLKDSMGKKEEIIWATQNNIPIEKTISCYVADEKTEFLACGACISCMRRKSAFLESGVKDSTKYYTKS